MLKIKLSPNSILSQAHAQTLFANFLSVIKKHSTKDDSIGIVIYYEYGGILNKIHTNTYTNINVIESLSNLKEIRYISLSNDM